MRMSRRMAMFSTGGGKIKEPLYTGDYTITQVGDFMVMHLLTSGTLTMQSDGEYDLFCVGAGGAGDTECSDDSEYGNGGGGGYTTTKLAVEMVKGSEYSVVIGSGATYTNQGSKSYAGTTSIGELISAKGGMHVSSYSQGNGGSGGANGSSANKNRNGGSDGSDGGGVTSKMTYGHGQGKTTRAFGESDNTLYAGGGGAGLGGKGGAGGGGNGYSGNTSGTSGTANTGGGGGGDFKYAKKGGSGIAIIRWKAA